MVGLPVMVFQGGPHCQRGTSAYNQYRGMVRGTMSGLPAYPTKQFEEMWMAQSKGIKLNYGRAIFTFILAYVVVTILGIALSVGIGIAGHFPETAEPMQNAAYLLSERFLPLLNLLVWMGFAWIYFRTRRDRLMRRKLMRRRETIALGAFWMALAVVVDYVGFVLIKNPISLSPHDFYIGQFPWIYLIYIAIFLSPLCYVALSGGASPKKLGYDK
jgi:hypothetical protein